MKTKFWLATLCCLPFTSFADEAAAPPVAPAAVAPTVPGDVCLIQGAPPSDFKYVVLRKVVAKKGTYGSVGEMLPGLASQAIYAGGTALINYNGGQHFGFWPWSFTRPVVSGTAIRWEGKAPTCTEAGGATVATVVAANQEPKKLKAAAAEQAATSASQPAQP